MTCLEQQEASCPAASSWQSVTTYRKSTITCSRDAWLIQIITDYRSPSHACDTNASLPDALNTFYAWLEDQNTETAKDPTPPLHQMTCSSCPLPVWVLLRVDPCEAAGPDNVPGQVLKVCADQLADIITNTFSTSLSQAVIPLCFKATTIRPVPKKDAVSQLSDCCPTDMRLKS